MMRAPLTLLAGLAAIPTLGGCGAQTQHQVVTSAQLTVWGPSEGVQRFAVALKSRKPVFATSEPKVISPGRQELVVTLPANIGGQDVALMTKDALAAGLYYQFERHQHSRT